jgi:hypothetical protein
MRKTFDVIVRNLKTFNLIISGITESTTFRFFIRNSVRIVAQFKQQMKFPISISNGFEKILFENIKLQQKVETEIEIRKDKITAFFSEIGRAETVIGAVHTIETNFQSLQKISTNIQGNPFRITIDPIIGQFRKLFNYDNMQLSEMDDQTLGDLDYTAS